MRRGAARPACSAFCVDPQQRAPSTKTEEAAPVHTMPSALLLYSVPEGVSLSMPGDSPEALLLSVISELSRAEPDFTLEDAQKAIGDALPSVADKARRDWLVAARECLAGLMASFIEAGYLQSSWETVWRRPLESLSAAFSGGTPRVSARPT